MSVIPEITDEAREILQNIRDCGELSYQQRQELTELVLSNMREKFEMARSLLDAWRRDDMRSDTFAE